MSKKFIEVRGPSIEETRKQFEKWRKSKKTRCPIPEELWEKATDLFPAYSISQISRALSLSYVYLKSRLQRKASGQISPFSAPGFIEIGAIDSRSESEWIMELEEQNGSRMRLTLRGKREVSFIEMVRAFWSKGR